ncbi:MAG: glycosyltransferase family 2 protein [Acidimicrobiia bacterium]|nr:glycosyltransferase family 2 protein [Acidimicrobiia bacterium]
MTPRVAFGMTLHNNARHLPAAIESLLAQDDPEFGLVMIDDSSTDATEEVARRYLADPRVRYRRHAARQGMVATWREAFDAARAEFPSAGFFAWASDHDWWHPDWLRKVRHALEARHDTVLAYALTQRVDDDLAPLGKPPKAFETTALDSPSARVLAFAAEPVGAGDMVYGLMRVEALERAGVFRPVSQPDRLLMVELALEGRFAQVPEVLWLRRQPVQASVEKQRASLFAEGMAPRSTRHPVWVQHSAVLVRKGVTGGLAGISRAAMAALIVRYQLAYLFRHHTKQGYVLHRLRQAWEGLHQRWKDARYRLRWVWYRLRMNLRPKHIARVIEKYVMHVVRRAVYRAAVVRRRLRAWSYEAGEGTRRHWGRVRRTLRKAWYEVLVLTHRLGLRGR